MKNINITKNRKLFFIISCILLLISIGSLFINGLNFGIDFIGGTIIEAKLGQTFKTEEIREITDAFDKSADITYSGDEKSIVIINTKKDFTQDEIKEIKSQFITKYGITENEISPINVSPTIGNELKTQALIATGVAILGMLIYITFRFEFIFGMAAILALAHDILIVLGVYSIFQIQVNIPFIAAILTILGYSINDTIVVFDRIRENRKKYKRHQLADLVNDSISQTITRSINTSVTTLLAIGALYFLGVQAIKDFALPMIVGFISGTYSSIFIASSFWFTINDKKLTKTHK
ncbi:MAG: protein translocase subunit SecF [Eubacteriales bacterium]